jgi:hypothetical protein
MPNSTTVGDGGYGYQARREREIAKKAWVRGRYGSGWEPDDPSSAAAAELAAYLDREHPLPQPEPKGVTGPSGTWYQIQPASSLLSDLWVAIMRTPGTHGVELRAPKADLPALANLLCPFEEVARALADELSDQGTIYMPRFEFPNFVRDHLPAILARLSRG